MILITGFEFMYRASLWFPTSVNKYIPAVKLGSTTGMEIRRLEDIWSEIQWGCQPSERTDDIYHK